MAAAVALAHPVIHSVCARRSQSGRGTRRDRGCRGRIRCRLRRRTGAGVAHSGSQQQIADGEDFCRCNCAGDHGSPVERSVTRIRTDRIAENTGAMSQKPSQKRTSPGIELRDYQIDALERIKKAYTDGRRRILVSLPTGTGKTVVFASFPRHFKMKKRLLVVAHREELLIQAEQKFRAIDPELKIGIERAGDYATGESQVVIASVPTLARSNGSRLSKFKPEDFSIVVVDEAHHAVADSYRVIFDHFDLFSPGTSRLLVGFTATPRRGDKQGL